MIKIQIPILNLKSNFHTPFDNDAPFFMFIDTDAPLSFPAQSSTFGGDFALRSENQPENKEYFTVSLSI